MFSSTRHSSPITRHFAPASRHAFTVLELATVILIIGILAVLLLPLFSKMRARAQRAQCTSNLHALYLAAHLYVQDKGNWPQIPFPGDDDSAEQTYATAWIDALQPYGVPPKTWICPTIENLMDNPDYLAPGNARIDYQPMPFDDKPTTPNEWPHQPWFVETADVHGHGNLLIYTDGTITDLKSLTR